MSNRRRPSRGNTYRTGHLTSPQWFARRDRWFREQLQIAGEWTCVGGVRTADRRELELHHLSYDGVKKTPAGWYADEAHEDLWPLHPACHELLHRIIDRNPLLARHRTRRQASATALQIVRRKHTIRRGRRIMSDDFDDFTVDEAVAAMQAEIDAVWVVNWRELDDETAHDVWGDLREWVERFTVRYQVSPTVIPNCWWKHGWLVEELSALRNAHRALFDPHDTGLGPIGWHERYALAIERIKKASSSAGCTNGHQETRPIRDWSDATDETEWDQWITRSHG